MSNKNSPTVKTFNLSDMNKKLDPFMQLMKSKSKKDKKKTMEKSYGKKSKYYSNGGYVITGR